MRRAFSALVLALVSGFVPSLQASTLRELVLEHDIQVGDSVSNSIGELPILVVIEVTGNGAKSLDRGLVREVVRQKFKEKAVRSEIANADFRARFIENRLSAEEILSPKLLVELEASRDPGDGALSIVCTLSKIQYFARGKQSFRATLDWSASREVRGFSSQEAEESLGRFLQERLGARLSPSRPKTVTKRRHLERSGLNQLQYRLDYNDPDHRRGRVLIGALFGTPALVNGFVGYWGSRKVPVSVGISGIYLSRERRGLELDAGWIFDNSGAVRQVVGLALIGNAERHEETRYERDDFGRVTSTIIETRYRVMPYAGPVYTFDWNGLRVQAGVAARLSSEGESAMRGVFQLGYITPVSIW